MPSVIPWSSNDELKYQELTGSLPTQLKSELLSASSSGRINSDTLKLYRSDVDNTLLLVCEVKREVGVIKTINDIRSHEPIAFKYEASDLGISCPAVYSERADFPRALSHLNPVSEGSPAHLCISRNNTQEIYDRDGITAIIERISQWLTDAAYGRLDKDGWEPRIVGYTAIDTQLSIAAIQELAAPVPKPVVKLRNFVVVRHRDNFEDPRANRMYAKIVDRNDADHESFKGSMKSYCELVIAGQQNRSNNYFNKIVQSADELLEFCDTQGIKDEVSQLLTTHRTDLMKRDSDIDLRFMLVAIHRDIPLRSSILGQSDNDDARKVEVIGFLLSYGKKNNKVTLDHIWQLNLFANPSPTLSAELSGMSLPSKSVAFVGAGAVGSLMALNHVKAGLKRATVIDHDHLMPHNIARHVLPPFNIGINKAIALKHFLQAYPDVQVQAKESSLEIGHVDTLSSNDYSYLVDSTSNPSVRKTLSFTNSRIPVVNVSIADAGRMGLFVSEDKDRKCRINDLFYYLYSMSYEVSEIRHWLRNNVDQEEIALGMGCSTATSRLPQAAIEGLTSSFFSSTRETNNNSLARIRAVILNDEGLPAKTISEDVPPPSQHKILDENGNDTQWSCRVFDSVTELLVSSMTEQAPLECGGFLYGKLDPGNKTITIVRAINVTPISASRTNCTLPPASNSDEHREYIRMTVGSLQLLGTWHSHPTSLSTPSATDKATIKERQGSDEFLFNGMMLIVGAEHDLSITCIL
jgi:proteasome lid subunit RPN8/RPN11